MLFLYFSCKSYFLIKPNGILDRILSEKRFCLAEKIKITICVQVCAMNELAGIYTNIKGIINLH